MKTTTWLASAGVLLLTACAGNPMADAPAAGDNPLMTRSTLQYQYPPFDKIRNEHYRPAFDAAMAQHLVEIQAIAANPEQPTFDNTIVAMERTGVMLNRVNTIFSALSGAHTNEEMKKIDVEVTPKLSAHFDEIFLNDALYGRVKALFDKRDALGLDAESARLLERYHISFVRAGARLSDEQKTKLKTLNGELATLETKFTQNLQNDSNASAVVVDTRAELEGMSEDGIAAAAEAAKARKLDGKYVISLILPTPQPALSQLKNRALRERIHKAATERANRGNEFDNKATLARIAKLRAERAAMMGYKTHADFVLEVETAKNKEAVNKLLTKLTPAAVANAKREAADMQKLIDQQKGGFKLQAWDWAFYAEQVRKAR
jgi:peptidyl-dipeptidase Dcp